MHVIGSIGEFHVLRVVHTLRETNEVAFIRIVSARKATRRKLRLDEENNPLG